MTTQRKEVVVSPDSLNPQHLPKKRAQNLLLWRTRHAPMPRAKFRRRQRSSVELAACRQRQTIQHHIRRRHHVLGKARRKMRTQLLRSRSPIRGRHHIGHQPLAPAPFSARNHRRLRNRRMACERRRDLARLDAEPAQLHLVVGPSQKLQHPVRTPAHQIPAPVHPAARRPERVRNKALPSQTPATQITTRHTRSRNVKLTNNPNRNRLQTTIQHVHLIVGQRTTDRDLRAGLLVFEDKSNCIDGRLRRTIKIADGFNGETSRNLFHKC